MKNAAKKSLEVSEKDPLEIIELAVNDIETLAKAFNLIKDVCEQRPTSVSLEAELDDAIIH